MILFPLAATTAADGTCEILAPSGEHDITASLAGFTSETASVQVGGGDGSFAIQLAPAPPAPK